MRGFFCGAGKEDVGFNQCIMIFLEPGHGTLMCPKHFKSVLLPLSAVLCVCCILVLCYMKDDDIYGIVF